MNIEYIMACLCGVETPCKHEGQQVGAVWQCPACKVATARVTPRQGGRAWITVQPSEVEFYDLLKESEDDDQ